VLDRASAQGDFELLPAAWTTATTGEADVLTCVHGPTRVDPNSGKQRHCSNMSPNQLLHEFVESEDPETPGMLQPFGDVNQWEVDVRHDGSVHITCTRCTQPQKYLLRLEKRGTVHFTDTQGRGHLLADVGRHDSYRLLHVAAARYEDSDVNDAGHFFTEQSTVDAEAEAEQDAEQPEAARLALQQAKAARLAAEEAESAKLAAEEAESAKLAAEEAEAAKLAAEEAEAARLAAEEAEAARLAAEEAESARLAAEEAEAARLAAEEAEAVRLAGEEAASAKLAAEEAESARLAAEEAEAARLAAEEAEAARLAAEEAASAKLAAEEAESVRLAAEEVEPEEQSAAQVERQAEAAGAKVAQQAVAKTAAEKMAFPKNAEEKAAVEESKVLEASVGPPPCGGTVFVDVIACNGVLPADKNGKSDPFVVARLGDAVAKTKHQSKTLCPVFKEMLALRVPQSSTQSLRSMTLVLEVWDWDRTSKNDFLGEVQIDLHKELGAVGWANSPILGQYLFGDPNERLGPNERKQVLHRQENEVREPYGFVDCKLLFIADDATHVVSSNVDLDDKRKANTRYHGANLAIDGSEVQAEAQEEQEKVGKSTHPTVKYEVVAKATVRASPDANSVKLGEHTKGTIIDVVRTTTNSDGLVVVQTSTPPAGWLKCKTSKGKPLVQQLNRRLQSSSISFEDESHDSLQTSGASNEEGHRDNRLTVETALKLYPADKDSSALSIRDGTSSNKGNRDSKLNRASGQSSARAESDSPRVTPEPPSEPAPQQRPKRRFSVSNLLSSVDMSSQMLQPGQKLWAVKQSHIKKAPASAQLLVGASSLTLFESAKTMRPLTSIQFGRIVSSKANTKRLLLRL
jgi:hypothetical protein